jgi:hypothetical protein
MNGLPYDRLIGNGVRGTPVDARRAEGLAHGSAQPMRRTATPGAFTLAPMPTRVMVFAPPPAL